MFIEFLAILGNIWILMHGDMLDGELIQVAD